MTPRITTVEPASGLDRPRRGYGAGRGLLGAVALHAAPEGVPSPAGERTLGFTGAIIRTSPPARIALAVGVLTLLLSPVVAGAVAGAILWLDVHVLDPWSGARWPQVRWAGAVDALVLVATVVLGLVTAAPGIALGARASWRARSSCDRAIAIVAAALAVLGGVGVALVGAIPPLLRAVFPHGVLGGL